MPDRPLVGSYRELSGSPPSERPQYVGHIGAWRELAPPPRDFPLRLVYLDRGQVHALLEQLAASRGGSSLLRLAMPDANGVVPANNAALTLLDLLSQVSDVAVFDLCQGNPSALNPSSLHPEQLVALTGSVPAPDYIRPGALRLRVDGVAVQVLLAHENVLHLNRGYLTSWTVKTICKVHSAPKMQFQAVAVAVTAA